MENSQGREAKNAILYLYRKSANSSFRTNSPPPTTQRWWAPAGAAMRGAMELGGENHENRGFFFVTEHPAGVGPVPGFLIKAVRRGNRTATTHKRSWVGKCGTPWYVSARSSAERPAHIDPLHANLASACLPSQKPPEDLYGNVVWCNQNSVL